MPPPPPPPANCPTPRNTQAECGSPDDIYFYSPWRAPGTAPVIDACGVAGGRHPGQGAGGAGADYMNTSLSKQGDLGSKLPAMKPTATWKVGAQVEAGWTVSAHHGGGYAYRLAPANAPLTEETFRKMPLDFVGNSILRWGGDKKTQLEFNSLERGWETNVGTMPPGSSWRKFPIPTVLWQREGPSFEPVCEESEECRREVSQNQYAWTPGVCKCSGHSNGGPLLPNIEMVDVLQIPTNLEPGKYVLQWRWDCEVRPTVGCASTKCDGPTRNLTRAHVHRTQRRKPTKSGRAAPTSPSRSNPSAVAHLQVFSGHVSPFYARRKASYLLDHCSSVFCRQENCVYVYIWSSRESISAQCVLLRLQWDNNTLTLTSVTDLVLFELHDGAGTSSMFG
jgi:hypothetical protein